MHTENTYKQQNNFNIVTAEFEAIKKWGYGAVPNKQVDSDWVKLKISKSSRVLNIKGLKKINKKNIHTKEVNLMSLNSEILLNS